MPNTMCVKESMASEASGWAALCCRARASIDVNLADASNTELAYTWARAEAAATSALAVDKTRGTRSLPWCRHVRHSGLARPLPAVYRAGEVDSAGNQACTV